MSTGDGGGEAAGRPGDGLGSLRARIDEIDRRLVELLNERARVVVEVGQVKRTTGGAVYAPHREQAVLSRVLGMSTGPLPARALEAIWRELMSGSFALERGIRVGYLGPPGSYSHQAATAQFGSSVELVDVGAIGAVFDEVRRARVEYGLVPIENTTGGGIAETLDAFQESRGDVAICSETLVAVHHNLLAACPVGEVKRIHSKPEALAQCRKWIALQCPGAELVPAASSSAAVRTAVAEIERDAGCGSAAVGSLLAGSLYGLDAVVERIEDNPNNITRFLTIGRAPAERSGDDKTSVMFRTLDKPGALVEALAEFRAAGVNLSHIDKRPSGAENWTYTFFVDAAGHRDDEAMRRAIDGVRRHCVEVIVLGSYPRAARVL